MSRPNTKPTSIPSLLSLSRKKMTSSSPFFFLLFFFLLFHAPFHLCYKPISSSSSLNNRRVLHQPFFPLPTTAPPPPSPSSPTPIFPKYPSSTNPTPFFPLYFSPPSPPSTTTITNPSSVPSSSTPTLPANITSLIFPSPKNARNKSSSSKKLVAAILLPILAVAVLGGLLLFVLLRRRQRKDGIRSPGKSVLSDSRSLFPPNITTSDGRKLSASATTTTVTASDFLYLGNVVNSRGTTAADKSSGDVPIGHGSPYRKLGSPELRPLPPLTKQSRHVFVNAEGGCSSDEEFYSPRGSSAGKESGTPGGSGRVFITPVVVPEKFATRNSNLSSPYQSSNSASSPTPPSSPSPRSSPPVSSSPGSSKSPKSRSEDLKAINGHMDVEFCHPPPPPPPIFPLIPSPPKMSLPSLPPPLSPPPAKDSHKSLRIPDISTNNPDSNVQIAHPPPPPPLPPPIGYWESKIQRAVQPPDLVSPRPTWPKNAAHFPAEPLRTSDDLETNNEERTRPKLKPLHWDKVRASSDRVMVWDQLRSSSFQLNEEMIETLFVCNPANPTPKESARKQVLPSPNQDNRVLDPKKSQNIAILLRALNVTKEEVCEALLEGNTDSLGTELLETLLKMAPSKEEEIKLKEYKYDSSPFKLGTAENFLKAVIDIPFAFKRVEAMLYTTNFDSEVNYLKKSFETLEAACEELRNSRMFLKLLEAVLKTGNRMNVGTNRGDARAFKLDTLLKLVDVKGTDGKTTLLHFVVQEIIRFEGSRLSAANKAQSTISFRDDLEFKKLGLQVVSGLSGELSNVKKAAAMDSDVLSSYVSKLAAGIGKVGEVVSLNDSVSTQDSRRKFHEVMSKFLKKAEDEIIRIQAQESVALSLVKEITEYFHGNSAREEAHPFRIFMVVRDFLSTLDQVCKEVGKINDRSIISSARQFPAPINPTIQVPVFQKFQPQRPSGSSEDNDYSSS